MKCPTYDAITTAFERNALDVQNAHEQGQKVVGQYCLYTPSEIALAAKAIPLGLCGTRNDTIPAAESVLPRSICPLIKSSYGFLVQNSCPYLSASDVVVADTTCDGKKKMYELMAEEKELILLQLPQNQNAEALAYWEEDLRRYVRKLEELFQITITEEDLRKAVDLMNRERKALKKLLDLAQLTPPAITGMEMVEVGYKSSFFPDKEKSVSMLNALADELKAMHDAGKNSGNPHASRILLTGVPVGMGSHKVIRLIEELGAQVVCLDNCSCYKKTRVHVEETGDPIHNIAKAYLNVPCSVMSPNPYRYEALEILAKDFKVNAIIDLTWQGCQTYSVEAHNIKKFVKNRLNLPYLQIETDYSDTDTEQLKVRIEAFLEMI